MMNQDRTPADMVLPQLGAVGAIVLNLAPEIGRFLFSGNTASTLTEIQAAVAAVTGSGDTGMQAAALADPDKAAALRVALAQITARQAEAGADRNQASLLAGLVATGPASTAPAAAHSVAYGAPLVSMVVLLTFALVVFIALTRTMPQGAEQVLNVLLGTLGAMATSVVGYWVGSSAGSARKDERLASLAERG